MYYHGNMKLELYIEKKKITADIFGGLVGVSGDSVRKWIRGERFPARHLRQIKEVTCGKVTAEDFMG